MSTTLLPQPTPQVAAAQPPRLLDQVAQAARQSGASEPTTAQQGVDVVDVADLDRTQLGHPHAGVEQ
ncbi:MAG: hypothetical protein ACK4RK_15945 [Gemmataceae bacterium]